MAEFKVQKAKGDNINFCEMLHVNLLSLAMAASKLNDSPGKNISIKDFFIIMVHFLGTILQIHLVTRRLCESSPRA